MRNNLLVKPFILGFILAALMLIFCNIVTFPKIKLDGFLQAKIANHSADAKFFAQLQEKFPGSVTSESLHSLIGFDNNNKRTATYFTDENFYKRWFFFDDNFETVYIKLARNPFSIIRLYFFLHKYTDEFFVEENFLPHIVSFLICSIFWLVLFFLSNNKFSFFGYGIIFLVSIFFTKDFVFTVATIFILYALFFWLYLLDTKVVNIKKRLKNNWLLCFVFAVGILLPLTTWVNSKTSLLLFYITVLFFLTSILFIRDLKILHQSERRKTEQRGELSVFSLFENKSFFQCEHFFAVSFIALIAISLLCVASLILNNRAYENNRTLSFVSQTFKTPSFSADSFFTAENMSMQSDDFCAGLYHFVSDCWTNAALDYTRVDKAPTLEHETSIYYNDFVDSNGKLVEVKHKVLEFDNDFIEKCFSIFSDKTFSQSNSLYAIMLEQKGFVYFSNEKTKLQYDSTLYRFIIFVIGVIVIGGIILCCIKNMPSVRSQNIKSFRDL